LGWIGASSDCSLSDELAALALDSLLDMDDV
jgi:hypothetical protein